MLSEMKLESSTLINSFQLQLKFSNFEISIKKLEILDFPTTLFDNTHVRESE